MNRSKRPHEKPQKKKQNDRRKPYPQVQVSEGTGTTGRGRIRKIHERVNDLIKEHSEGISIPHNPAVSSIWGENAKYSQNLLVNFTIYLDALEAKNNYFLDREAMPGSLSRAMSEYENLKNKPFSEGEITDIEEKYDDDPWLDSDFVCAFTNEFLKSDYEPPANNATGIQAHLQHINWCYSYCLPCMDKIYPIINMKLDSAFARLSHVTGIFFSVILSKGKSRDQRKNAGGSRTEGAKTIHNEVADLIPLIAREKNKDRITELENQAKEKMKMKYRELHPGAKEGAPKYQRVLENLVTKWKIKNGEK